MNFAEATAALSKKETEKSQVEAEIYALEEKQMNGLVAVLHATVYNIESAPELTEPTITFHFIEEDDSKHEHTDKVVSEAVQFNLKSKTGKLVMTCTMTTKMSDPEHVEAEYALTQMRYTAELNLNEIPEDGEMRTEVVAQLVSEGDETEETVKAVTLHLKASVDDLASAIVSKTVVMAQLQQEFDEIVTTVQDLQKKASAKPAAAKGKAGGKKVGGKKAAKGSASSSGQGAKGKESTEAEEEEDNTSQVSAIFTTALQYGMLAGGFLAQNRAYVLFPAMAALIHVYGEFASV